MKTDDAVTHLQEARASLTAQRADVEKAIKDIDRLLGTLNQTGATGVSGNGQPGSPTAIRNAVIDVLSDHRSRRIGEIQEDLSEVGTEIDERPLRAGLAAMVRDGSLILSGRGWYTIGRTVVGRL
jgi:hypothetical protein